MSACDERLIGPREIKERGTAQRGDTLARSRSPRDIERHIEQRRIGLGGKRQRVKCLIRHVGVGQYLL